MLTVSERLTLMLIGSSLYLVALKADPQSGPLVLGYHLAVTLMVTTPRPPG